MPRYFNKFPTLAYTKQGVTTIVTNLLARIDVVRNALDNVSLFYEYNIQEGDTPEIIASKYYNDPELHWIVLIFNNIIDPFYDWPMTYNQFQKFITSKYDSVEKSKITHHHYEKIIKKTDNGSGTTTTDKFILPLTVPFINKGNVANVESLPTSNNETGDGYVTLDAGDLYVWDGFDWTLQPSFKDYNEIVPSTETLSFTTGGSVSISLSKRDVDCYTYEDELNESKRVIKLIKAELAPEIVKQFETLMRK